MKCHFCGDDYGKLANSHIIPRSFFKHIKGKAKYSVYMSASDHKIRQQCKQAGISDKNIICVKCEKCFSPYDDHGYRVFTSVFKERSIYLDQEGNGCALLLPKVKYPLLKLFVLSMLWRASVSQHDFFKRVSIGYHEDKIKELIKSQQPGLVDQYSFFCLHHYDQPYENLIFPPTNTKFVNTECVRFYLPNVTIIIKLDNHPFDEAVRTLMIKEEPPHYLALMPYKGSMEQKYLSKLVRILRSPNHNNV